MSQYWKGSHALLFAYPIITYYLVLVSLPYWSASKIVKHYVSQSPFVKHCVVSPQAVSTSDVVFSKCANCLENDFWFGYNTRSGQKTSLPSLSFSMLRCREEVSEKSSPSLIEPGFSPATLLLSLMADIFLKRQDWMCWYYHATQNTTEFLHLYFCLRVMTVRYFSRFLCLIKCCCLSPDSVTLNYSGRLQSVSFLSSKKSLKII